MARRRTLWRPDVQGRPNGGQAAPAGFSKYDLRERSSSPAASRASHRTRPRASRGVPRHWARRLVERRQCPGRNAVIGFRAVGDRRRQALAGSTAERVERGRSGQFLVRPATLREARVARRSSTSCAASRRAGNQPELSVGQQLCVRTAVRRLQTDQGLSSNAAVSACGEPVRSRVHPA